MTGLWSNLSTGIASSLLNRSLGLSANQAGQLGNSIPPKQPQSQEGSEVTSPETPDPAALNDERKKELAQDQIARGDNGKHPPTLIDAEMETLYAGFQRQLNGQEAEGGILGIGKGTAIEEQARKLKREDQKVRALNSNGRVDYSIQE